MDLNDSLSAGTVVFIWESEDRKTARVMLMLTLTSTALLLLWAMVFVIIRSNRSSRREQKVKHFLNILYICCLLLTIVYYAASMYVTHNDTFCSNLKSLSYFLSMTTLSTNLLTSWHSYMMSCQRSMTSLLSGTAPQILFILGLYFGVSIGIPLINTSLHIHLQASQPEKSITTCWLALQDIWWLIVPVLMYISGSILIMIFTCLQFRTISTRHRCKVYSNAATICLFTMILTASEIDKVVHSVTTAFIILCLFLIHNVAVWLVMTENILEICPGSIFIAFETVSGDPFTGFPAAVVHAADRGRHIPPEQRAGNRPDAGTGRAAAPATRQARSRSRENNAGVAATEDVTAVSVWKSISVDDAMGATGTETADSNEVGHHALPPPAPCNNSV